MSSSMNHVVLVGTVDELPASVGGDPEDPPVVTSWLRENADGRKTTLSRFRLRTPKTPVPNRQASDYEYHWIEVTGRNADWALYSLKYGDLVVVIGHLSYDLMGEGAEKHYRAVVKGRATFVAEFGRHAEVETEEASVG